jgi:hypothetical protein
VDGRRDAASTPSLGGHVPAADLTAALESLKQQGIVECHTIATVSKPADVWSLIHRGDGADPRRANEQSLHVPREDGAADDFREASFARTGSATDPGPSGDIRVELF